jgi:lipocalin
MTCVYSTADYRYNSQGNYINILNTCYDENNIPKISITRIGKPQNDKGDFLIKFSSQNYPFPVSPFPAPYNVLWTDYNNLAFVGGGFSYYILSRRPFITQDEFQFIQNMTKKLGYNLSDVKFNKLPG